MLNAPNIPAFGKTEAIGMTVPGVFGFGRENDDVKPDLSPIDMTTEPLDLRLRYHCDSQHAYIGTDGFLHYAGIDKYPVEYDPVTRLPLGRHEPEPQATNIFTGGTPFAISSVGNQTVVAGSKTYGDADTYRYTWNLTPTGNNYNLSQRAITIPSAGMAEYYIPIEIIQSSIAYDETTISSLLDVFWSGSGTMTKSNVRTVRKLADNFYLCAVTITTIGREIGEWFQLVDGTETKSVQVDEGAISLCNSENKPDKNVDIGHRRTGEFKLTPPFIGWVRPCGYDRVRITVS
ncbi:hypothetical protein I2494_20170 [Budviciaceae bacterium BWR-B9]|uniref:Uncharacterized protein n=1 Tax=Limnobaculum allomyrinae TaxID=2791986 RepID=A0ABS1IW58_9GAMM|nr:hypothetical protein [Limnobaculum allomyrinae]MBK5145988.1 hypothetical protein [Limnobaculum allomyrinae]